MIIRTLALIFSAMVSPYVGALTMSSADLDGVTYIAIAGEFSDQTTSGSKMSRQWTDVRDFDQLMSAQLTRRNPIAVFASSEGGTLATTTPLAQRLVQWSQIYRERRGVPLLVSFMLHCSSACTFFSSALTKLHNPRDMQILSPKSTVFQFHGPINLDTGQPFASDAEYQYHLSIGLAEYKRNGVSLGWLKKLSSAIKGSGTQSYMAKKLCAENIGILPRTACVENYEAVMARVAEIKRLSQYRPPTNPLEFLFNLILNN